MSKQPFHVIAFVNTGSGGNKGKQVLELLKIHLGEEHVYDIKSDKGPDRGLKQSASDPNLPVNCVVAGGDGTFSWVANAVEKQRLSHVHLTVLPLGSGNDMSRALGWGKKFPGLSKIEQYLKWMNVAPIHQIDVWRLKAVENTGHISTDDVNIPHGARPLVCNYLSLGADAFVELRFNQLRWENPEKYKTRLGNFKAHAVVGLKYICNPPSRKIHVADHVETLLIDDHSIQIPEKLQALIILNIPSYGAGTNPWGFPGNNKPTDINSSKTVDNMHVDDQTFEVFGLKSLTHFNAIKFLGASGVRIAQGKKLYIKLKSESTPFQVDGEPWEQRGGEVSMEPGNKVGIIQGPVWSPTSRRQAKFDLVGEEIST